jgi:hypothetical protein
MFSSPEYVYQPDDIQDIIKQNKYSINIKDVCSYNVDTTVREFRYRPNENGGNYYTKGLLFSSVLGLSNTYARWMGV